MSSFDPSAYGPEVARLLRDVPLAPLDAGSPNEKVRAELASLTPEKLFAHTGQPIRDPRMAQCCLAGLWLRHNFLDESHAISQEIETPAGGLWHAILHRREPDYGNARYWCRRVGSHPIFPKLNELAIPLGWTLSPRWDSFAFVDRVEQVCRKKDLDSLELCLTLQQFEWELLFDYSWQHSLA